MSWHQLKRGTRTITRCRPILHPRPNHRNAAQKSPCPPIHKHNHMPAVRLPPRRSHLTYHLPGYDSLLSGLADPHRQFLALRHQASRQELVTVSRLLCRSISAGQALDGAFPSRTEDIASITPRPDPDPPRLGSYRHTSSSHVFRTLPSPRTYCRSVARTGTKPQ